MDIMKSQINKLKKYHDFWVKELISIKSLDIVDNQKLDIIYRIIEYIDDLQDFINDYMKGDDLDDR